MTKVEDLLPERYQAMVDDIAELCHETIRIYNESIGTYIPTWSNLKKHQRRVSTYGVDWYVKNPTAGPEESHDAWLQRAELGGWKYGPVVDYEKREHPCLVPFLDLPEHEKRKEYIFRCVALASLQQHLSKIQ